LHGFSTDFYKLLENMILINDAGAVKKSKSAKNLPRRQYPQKNRPISDKPHKPRYDLQVDKPPGHQASYSQPEPTTHPQAPLGGKRSSAVVINLRIITSIALGLGKRFSRIDAILGYLIN
jgi:hypothetical protein